MCANFDIFKANGEVGYHTGMHIILKVLVGRLTHHTHRPLHMLGPFILTLGKNFPDLLHYVDQDDVEFVHVL